MKKTLLSILAVLTVVGSAVALPTPEKRKEECLKHPDKYIWVERTKACIPINPCNSSDSDIVKAYCNRDFADFESPAGTEAYIDLINIYAATHGLDCRGVAQDAKAFGQDYVMCKGTDVMVFEFDDINDYQFWHLNNWEEDFIKYLCIAGRGTMNNDTCQLSPESVCIMSDRLLQKYPEMTKFLKSTTNGDICEVGIDKTLRQSARDASEAIQNYNNSKI